MLGYSIINGCESDVARDRLLSSLVVSSMVSRTLSGDLKRSKESISALCLSPIT